MFLSKRGNIYYLWFVDQFDKRQKVSTHARTKAERVQFLQKTREIAKGLKRVEFAVDWILTSPLLRALETAEIVRDTLKLDTPFDHCDALRPGLKAEELMKFLCKRPERKRVLLVGHEPDLGQLAASLLGAGDEANLTFKKGGCCLIAVEQLPPRSPGELVWWLSPRVLRALA